MPSRHVGRLAVLLSTHSACLTLPSSIGELPMHALFWTLAMPPCAYLAAALIKPFAMTPYCGARDGPLARHLLQCMS